MKRVVIALVVLAASGVVGCTDYCEETCEIVKQCGSEQATARFCECPSVRGFVEECVLACVKQYSCQAIHDYAIFKISPAFPNVEADQFAVCMFKTDC